jgi:hypothetical protein
MSDQLRDFYDTGDDEYTNVIYSEGIATGVGQSFTAGASYTITKIMVKALRVGDPTYAALTFCSGIPTDPWNDAISAAGPLDVSDLTTNEAGAWLTFTLLPPVVLIADSVSSFFIWLPGDEGVGSLGVRLDTEGSSYSGGRAYGASYDSALEVGQLNPSYPSSVVDCMFRTYSDYEYVFSPPYDVITYKRLVAAAANTFWYEAI